MIKKIFSILIFALILASCSKESNKPEESVTTVKFEGREVDLKPFFEGFPYSGFFASYADDKIYYFDEGTTRTMHSVLISGSHDLAKGLKVTDIDFSTRNFWGARFDSTTGAIYWLGDENNNEMLNVFSMNPTTGRVEKLTNYDYLFGFGISNPQKNHSQKLAYIVRKGTKDTRKGVLHIVGIDAMVKFDQVVTDDVPALRFSWCSPTFSPDNRYLAVNVNKDADRSYGNIAYLDLNEKKPKLILVTDSTKHRQNAVLLDKWLSPVEFAYISNEEGYQNIYIYNIKTKETRKITNFNDEIDDAKILNLGNEKLILAIAKNPIKNTVYLVDPNDGKILTSMSSDLNLTILDDSGNKVMVQGNSNTVKFIIDELTVYKNKIEQKNLIKVPAELEKQIVRADVENIEYPTFDIDPHTGKTRMIHAFLFKPQNPLPKDKQIVMIQSFYGGENMYIDRNQILAAAGIYVLSPSPRGSDGFGKEFYALNDKDLGGNEIIDIIYAGKYISEKLGIPPSRIGVFGGSHGGYATMRLMTFPGEVNGHQAQFPWGFGISHAGFSDIIAFYEKCNIPDWVTLEAGDPVKDHNKLIDRSPLYHAENMNGRLLLTYGSNDSRVPNEGSIKMANSLKKYNKNYKLVEFKGQGHDVKGLANQIKLFKAWFDFLKDVE